MKVWGWRDAIRQSRLSSTTKLVLYNLANYMNEIGEGCFPSVSTQARDTGLTERSVYAALAMAEGAGFLKRGKMTRRGVERNEYVAAYPSDATKHYGLIPRTSPATEDQKETARKWVSNNLASGNIVQRQCMVCGSEKTEAHHHDYTQKEEIYWLCRAHHQLIHNCEKGGYFAQLTPEYGSPPPLNLIHPTPEYGSPPPLNMVQGLYKEEHSNEHSKDQPNACARAAAALVKIFGEELGRVYGSGNDYVPKRADQLHATEFLEAGVTPELFRAIVREKLERQRLAELPMPTGLVYFRSIVPEELAMRSAAQAVPPETPYEITLELLGGDTPENHGLLQMLGHAREKHGEAVFRSWLSPLRVAEKHEKCIIFTLPTRFMAGWVQKAYGDAVRDAARTVWPDIETVNFEVRA